MAANFQRGNTPIAGQVVTSRDFGNLANASTAARQSPSSDVFGVQAGGGFVAFPVANRPTLRTIGQLPFSVTIIPNPSTPGEYLASVYWNSSLLQNLVLNNTQVITGLADAPPPTGDGNPNYFNFDYGNDLIWLEIVLDGSGNMTDAYINSYGMTSPPATNIWAPSDLPGEYGSGHGFFEYQITFDSNGNKIFSQYIARIPILESTTSATTPFPVSNIQMLSSNLIMVGDIYSGALFTTADGPAVIGLMMPQLFSAPFITT